MSDDTVRNDVEPVDATDAATAEQQPGKRLSRRGLFRAGAATGLTAAGAYTATLPGVHSETEAAPAPASVIPVSEVHQVTTAQTQVNDLAGYTFFNPEMVDVISAAADRIIPADALSPSATDSGVVYFLDRQLSSEYGMVGKRYLAGPFAAGAATQGDQLGLSMRDRYRLGVTNMQAYAQQKYQKNFKDLTTDQQDQVLRDMEAGTATGFTGVTPAAFFQLLVSHVKAGFLADPIYGGNRGMVGWKMIGFPGAQIVYQDWIGRYGQKFTGPYMSLADHQEALHPKPNTATQAMTTGMTMPAASPGPTGTAAATTAATAAPASATAAPAAPAATAAPSATAAPASPTAPAASPTAPPAPAATTAPATTIQPAVTLPPGTTPSPAATVAPTATIPPVPTNPPTATSAPTATTAPSATSNPTAAAAPSTMAAAPATGGGTMVNVIMKDFSFAFDKSTAPPGNVTFNITNQGPSPHNLEFTSLMKVSDTIDAGQMTKLTVMFQAGMYDYICNIPGHAQLGMKGTFTVK